MDEQGLTLIEVLIASVITLVLFLALMQAALLSVEVNAGKRGSQHCRGEDEGNAGHCQQ
jgi:prepilin-type N-terminal cleavage/methylation domain-containing protein